MLRRRDAAAHVDAVLGQDVEAKAKPKLFSVRDALDDYQANQALLQTKSYFENAVRSNKPTFSLAFFVSNSTDGYQF